MSERSGGGRWRARDVLFSFCTRVCHYEWRVDVEFQFCMLFSVCVCVWLLFVGTVFKDNTEKKGVPGIHNAHGIMVFCVWAKTNKHTHTQHKKKRS